MLPAKKLKAIACVLALTAALCGCKKNTEGSQTAESSGAVSSASDSAAEGSTAADEKSNGQSDSKPENSQDSSAEESASGKSGSQSEESTGEDSGSAGSNPTAAESTWTAEHPFEIGTEPTIAVEPFSVRAGDKNVPVNVKIWNNPGFTSGGIQVYLDPAVKPVVGEIEELVNKPKVKIKLGTTVDGFMYSCLYGEEDNVVGIGFAGGSNQSLDNGTIFTFYIDVPADAESGTQYEIRTNVDSLSGNDRKSAKVQVPVSVITVE